MLSPMVLIAGCHLLVNGGDIPAPLQCCFSCCAVVELFILLIMWNRKYNQPEDSMTKERNSIIELFRLISMWCVVAHHFVIHNADDISVFASPVTRLIFKGVFLPIGKVAVGCFVFITVWFIADRASFSIKDAAKKLVILNNEVVFYSIILGIISVITGSVQPSASFIVNTVFPIATGYGWWFTTSYAGLILLLPYILKGLQACGRKEHKYLAVSLTFGFGLFRYLPFVSFPAEGMLVDLIVLAIDICYFRWYIDLNTTNWNKLALAGAACFVSGICFLYLPYHSQGIIHDFSLNLFNGYVYSSANILSMGLSFAISLSVFKLCLVLKLNSSRLNWIAGSAFAVYLITDYSLVQCWLWKSLFTFTNLGNQHGVLLVVLIPSFVMACCLTIDIGRRTIDSHLALVRNSTVRH